MKGAAPPFPDLDRTIQGEWMEVLHSILSQKLYKRFSVDYGQLNPFEQRSTEFVSLGLWLETISFNFQADISL